MIKNRALNFFLSINPFFYASPDTCCPPGVPESLDSSSPQSSHNNNVHPVLLHETLVFRCDAHQERVTRARLSCTNRINYFPVWPVVRPKARPFLIAGFNASTEGHALKGAEAVLTCVCLRVSVEIDGAMPRRCDHPW